MRYSFVAAFASVAAANPLGYGGYGEAYNVYPTGGNPSSSSKVEPEYPTETPTPSSIGYPVNTPYPVSAPPSSVGYPVQPPSSSVGYQASSAVSSVGYSASTPASSKPGNPASSSLPGYPIHTPSNSDGYPVPSQPSSMPHGTGYSSASQPGYPEHTPSTKPHGTGYSPSQPGYPEYTPSSKPHGTGYSTSPQPTTTEYTTYTTTTVCPITQTHGTQIITTSTTSTVTVTSCKKGCHQQTSAIVPTPTPSQSKPPQDVTTTITQTTYKWVPCSTPVGHNGGTTVYSTYLTPSYTTQTLTSTIYGCGGKSCATPVVPAPKPSSDKPVSPNENTPKPQLPIETPAVPVPDNCPAPSTKTVTEYVQIPAGTPVPGYVTKTITVTEEGHPQTYTVTIPGPKPTQPGQSDTTSDKPQPSVGYSHPVPSASSAPYPITKPSGHPTASASSVGYHINKPSSSVESPVHVASSSKPTPTPTGYAGYEGYGQY
jgi:hypothetical protein